MKLPFKADLEGKTAVITGGGGVLCSSFARALALCGAKVAVIGRTAGPLETVCEDIAAAGGTAIAVTADVLDKASLELAHAAVSERLGGCDILINGAGGNDGAATTADEYFDMTALEAPGKQSFFDLPADAVAHVFGTNLIGVMLSTQIFSHDMIGSGKTGCIINISSMNAYRPLTKIPAYSAAKAAVSNFTQWLAVYFAKTGIRANAIAPGFFSTKQNRDLLWNADGTPTARSGKILAATPMGRFGEVDDLIGTLLFLADENCSRFITGITIPVDGGFSAYSGV